MAVRVAVSTELPGAWRAALPPWVEVVVAGGGETLARVAGGAAGVVTLLTDRVDEALLAAAGADLRVVANYAVGTNNIDLEACSRRGVAATNTPDVLTEATADVAFGLLLAVARRFGEGERLVRERRWTGWAPDQLLGRDVGGATLGLIGIGRIGRAVARRAVAFGMRVAYWNRTRLEPAAEAAAGVAYLGLPELLAESDFVSLHCALAPETRHLLGARELSMMKPGAILVNTARGPIVDEVALVAALRSGHLGGAGLDVYEREPVVEEALLARDDVVLLPHLGSATVGTRARMAVMALANVVAALRGERPPQLVDRAAVLPWEGRPLGA